MRQLMRLLIALSVVGALLAPALAAGASASTGGRHGQHWVAGAYIISLKDGVSVDDVAQQEVIARGGAVSQRYHAALNGFAASLSEAAINDLAADERVESVMPDFEVHASGQTTPTGIQRIQATSSSLAHIDGVDERVDVDVAVLDTGSGPHTDLNIAGGYNCTSSNTSAYNDDNGHGTHVAGTIGAIDNGSGVVGVAPGARIWSIKVLDKNGSGTGSQILCGIDWVKQHASTIEVANMSLGGSTTLKDDGNCGNTNGDSIHKAICGAVAAGVTFAVAAGNDGKDAAGFFPAQYDEVITVSALDDTDGKSGGLGQSNSYGNDDTLASFSNYGADVDVIAPGVGIYSTYLNNAYGSMSGTSMATPHVTGAAALYKAGHASATPAQVRSALISTGSNGSWSGDKDSSKEPLINVATFAAGSPGGGGATHDASVNTVSVGATVQRGAAATVTAAIGNNGSATETIAVSFKETPGGATQSKSVSVAAGASSNVSFSWVTNSATALGTHTFTISASVASDSNAANNSKSASTTVQTATGGATHDASVSSVSVGATVKQGVTATVTATVRNNGSATATIAVAFKETPGGATQSKSVSVAAGASTNVSFSWVTNTATALGTHTFTVTASVASDSNAANNTGTATTTVQSAAGSTSATMSVSNITMSKSKLGSGYRLTTQVYVKSGGVNVASAKVTIKITYPNGSSASMTATTNSAGYATFPRTVTSKGSYKVEVTSITKTGLTYNAAANVMTSKSLTVS